MPEHAGFEPAGHLESGQALPLMVQPGRPLIWDIYAQVIIIIFLVWHKKARMHALIKCAYSLFVTSCVAISVN